MADEFDALETAIAPLRASGLDVSLFDSAVNDIKTRYIKKLPEYFQRIGYLRYLATDPKTIIDIGVSTGTPKLYEAFNHLPFLLVDPQRNSEQKLKYKPAKYTFVEKGLGAERGTLTLNESASQSSFIERDGVFVGDYKVESQYEVDVITFKDMIDSYKPEPPYGVKIDTEGFELEVVKGMVGAFDDIDFLICETSIRRVYRDSYQFSELVAFLANHGLLFYNILNDVSPWPRYYDTVFLRKDNPKFTSVT
ncbi:FkbM family methyltransferase [Neorhizobium sp. Rsf11]|uniref:FkbM family methyltransferase n=1 Tax=Neorhizobium phenanthreniclasticum TaxID=3157917 RepID=A0ABV0LX60_9HYPH